MGVQNNTELLSLIQRVQGASGGTGSVGGFPALGGFGFNDIYAAEEYFNQLSSGDGEQQAQAVQGILSKVVSFVSNRVAEAKTTDTKNQKAVNDATQKEKEAENKLNERINTFNTNYSELSSTLDGLLSNLDDSSQQTKNLVQAVENLKQQIEDKQKELEAKQAELESATTEEERESIRKDMETLLSDMQGLSDRLSSIAEAIQSVQSEQEAVEEEAEAVEDEEAEVVTEGENGVTEASDELSDTADAITEATQNNVSENVQGGTDTATGEALIAEGQALNATGYGSIAGTQLVQKGQDMVSAGTIETTGATANQAALGAPIGSMTGNALPSLMDFAVGIDTQNLEFVTTLEEQFNPLDSALIESIGSFVNVGSTGEAISNAVEEDMQALESQEQTGVSEDEEAEAGEGSQLQSTQVNTDELDEVEIEV